MGKGEGSMGKGEGSMGKGKRKQDVTSSDRGSKRPWVDGASSSASAHLGNGGGLHGSSEDVTLDNHSVSKESPPPQASTQFIVAQGEPPTKWNFNLEEGSPGGALALPPVPDDWVILEALHIEEERTTLPEALFMAMVRCCKQHHMVGEERRAFD